ncbi:MAG: hypothetical protein WD830_11720 [Chloroflexota bacterium]
MADIDKIVRLVSEGVLSAGEADEILSATTEAAAAPPTPGARHLRVEVSEGGRRVVNLRVPMNIAGWASSFLPGLSDDHTNRIRGAIVSGERGPILDINGEDGSRVLIVSE